MRARERFLGDGRAQTRRGADDRKHRAANGTAGGHGDETAAAPALTRSLVAASAAALVDFCRRSTGCAYCTRPRCYARPKEQSLKALVASGSGVSRRARAGRAFVTEVAGRTCSERVKTRRALDTVDACEVRVLLNIYSC